MWILFFIALLLLPSSAGAAEPAAIIVLLQQQAHRDADLRRAPLTQKQFESLKKIAGVDLAPDTINRDGSHRLLLPDASVPGDVLQRLREDPMVLYADREPPAVHDDPTTAGTQTLDRLVILFRDPQLRDLSDLGGEFPAIRKSELIHRAGIPLYIERPMSGGAWVLRLFQRMPVASVQAIAQRLAADDSVSWVVPAVRGRFQTIPNDPLYAEQWPLHDPLAGIDAPTAWQWTTGSPHVVVAVLDSGVRTAHPDLQPRLLAGFDFVSDVWRAGDYNSRDDSAEDPGDAARKHECSPGAPASRSSWHGTHVAGTIGAVANNRQGTAGVDWASRILPVRIGGKCGIDPIDLADAIRWASGTLPESNAIPANRHPAAIINLSVGFPGSCPPYVQDAISNALAAGALIVAAAGNHQTSAENYYPANCAGVLSVAATDRWGGRAAYSNFGRVHLAAPGGSLGEPRDGGVLSTINEGVTKPANEGYGYKLGTSMAAPHVSGVAALILARNPDLRPGQIFNRLTRTAREFPTDTNLECTTGGTYSCGAGILDAGGAVSLIEP